MLRFEFGSAGHFGIEDLFNCPHSHSAAGEIALAADNLGFLAQELFLFIRKGVAPTKI